jgi:hypothetical protein
MKIKSITLSILFVVSYVTVFGQFSPNQPDLQVLSKEKAQIIDTILKAVKSSYIFPEISLQIRLPSKETKAQIYFCSSIDNFCLNC